MAKTKAEKKADVDELLKEKADVESMMSYLEDDYRKANVSEKSYAELKGKHAKKLEEINQKLAASGVDTKSLGKAPPPKREKEEEPEEAEKEEPEEEKREAQKEGKQHEERPKIGFLKKIFGGGEKGEGGKEDKEDEKKD